MGDIFSSQENEPDTFEENGLICEYYSDNNNDLTANESYILNLLLYIDTNDV